jgi:2-polyprenyl-3-methyl-5-hydroxy-6-metoxy-1,4-benzoquinol methylase
VAFGEKMMDSFKQHIPAFAEKLSVIDVTTITTDAYAQQYLKDLLHHKIHYLNLYALVLDKAFQAYNKKIEEACLLDFGCGNGLLALFAKHCGIKQIFASDMSEPFLLAAKQLGHQLHVEIEGWILGDEKALLQTFADTPLDIIVGTDVIEHVYSLDSLFKTIKQLNLEMVTVFTTASVAENPFKSRQLKKLMMKDEYVGSNELHSAYSNEFAGLPFLTIRKKLIAAKYPSLKQEEVNELAFASRGLMENDIYKDVAAYLATKKFSLPIKHPTNTCDPITGSWTERLLIVKEYEQLYKRYQFSLEVENGFYNAFENNMKSTLSSLLNKAISFFGKKGITISPFIVLIGKKA